MACNVSKKDGRDVKNLEFAKKNLRRQPKIDKRIFSNKTFSGSQHVLGIVKFILELV